MRSRNIKPSFFLNEELAECGEAAMLLFSGLWCMADRDGKLEDRPARIKAAIMPYFNHNCNELLDSLNKRGFIYRYEVDDKRYLIIPKFKQHQFPHHRENGSVIPDPKGGCEKPRACLGLDQGKPGTSPSDSLNLIPESVTLLRQSAARDFLFDAIVNVTHADPSLNGSQIGRVCSDLRRADPPYTADEVLAIPRALMAQGMTFPVTLGMVVKYIPWVRNPPPKSGRGAKPNTDSRAAFRAAKEKQNAAKLV